MVTQIDTVYVSMYVCVCVCVYVCVCVCVFVCVCDISRFDIVIGNHYLHLMVHFFILGGGSFFSHLMFQCPAFSVQTLKEFKHVKECM